MNAGGGIGADARRGVEVVMVSPYLKRPLRSYQQALEDRANRRAPEPGVPVSAERRSPVELRREAPETRSEAEKKEPAREREKESAA